MQPLTLLADSGSTKAEWCLMQPGRKKIIVTQGISPYFLDTNGIVEVLKKELAPKLKNVFIENLFYYGTGCATPKNASIVSEALKTVFPDASVQVQTDLMAAAHATCGHEKGIACILGTGSNSGYYDGSKIMNNSPGLGYVLGDEGSGAYLGRKVLQYYLYNTLDEELHLRFIEKYPTNAAEILDHVYKKPMANRYLASFAPFLAENRGHYMVENVLEDGLNDFFFQHLCKYSEIWKYPVHFVGSIADGFRDILEELCHSYEFELGVILKSPMPGLIKFYRSA